MDEETSDPKRALVKRAGKDGRGRFVKGHSFGKGRPKGSKNKATLVREQMEQKSTLMIGRMAPHLVKKALDMALDGNVELLREFLARINPKQKKDGDDHPDHIEITINQLVTSKESTVIEAEMVDDLPALEHQPQEEIVDVVVATDGLHKTTRT